MHSETTGNTSDLLTPAQVAECLPTRPNAATIQRWIRDGVLAPSGRRVRLRALRAGRSPMIRRDDLNLFLRECAERAAEPAEGVCQ